MAATADGDPEGFSRLKQCQTLCARGLFSEALEIAEALYAEAVDNNNEKVQALACSALSSACGGMGDFAAALKHSHVQLDTAVKLRNTKLQANAHSNMALAAAELGRYQESIQSLEVGLELLESQEEPDQRQLCVALLNLAATNADCRQFDKAFQWTQRLTLAAEKLEGTERTEFQGRAHGVLARIHRAYGKLDAAENHAALRRGFLPAEVNFRNELKTMSEEGLKSWLQKVRETRGGVILECEALQALGRKLLIRKDFEAAAAIYEECVAVRRASDGSLGLAQDLKMCGVSLLLAGRHSAAVEALEEAVQIFLAHEQLSTRDELLLGIFEGQADAFRLLQLALLSVDRDAEALAVCEHAKARALLRQLASASASASPGSAAAPLSLPAASTPLRPSDDSCDTAAFLSGVMEGQGAVALVYALLDFSDIGLGLPGLPAAPTLVIWVLAESGALLGCERVCVASALDGACCTLEEQAELLLASLGAHGRVGALARGHGVRGGAEADQEGGGEEAAENEEGEGCKEAAEKEEGEGCKEAAEKEEGEGCEEAAENEDGGAGVGESPHRAVGDPAQDCSRPLDGLVAEGGGTEAEAWLESYRERVHAAARCAVCGDCRLQEGRWSCRLCGAGTVLCRSCAGSASDGAREGSDSPQLRQLQPLEGFVSEGVLQELQDSELMTSLGAMVEQYLELTQLLHSTLSNFASAADAEAAGFAAALAKLTDMQSSCLQSVMKSVRGLDEAALVSRQARSLRAAADGSSKIPIKEHQLEATVRAYVAAELRGVDLQAALVEVAMQSPERLGTSFIESARKPWLSQAVSATLAQHRRLARWLRSLPVARRSTALGGMGPTATSNGKEREGRGQEAVPAASAGQEDTEKGGVEGERAGWAQGLEAALLTWKDLKDMADRYAVARRCSPSERELREAGLDGEYGGWGPAERESVLQSAGELLHAERWLHSFHRLLLRPVRHLLHHRHLLIIPDGALAVLPWPALMAEDGECLVQRHTIRLAPSLRVAQEASRSGTAPNALATTSNAAKLVVVGNPWPLPPQLELCTLGAAEKEAAAAAVALEAAWGGGPAVVLQGATATKAQVTAALSEARWVHLACHALLEEQALALASPPRPSQSTACPWHTPGRRGRCLEEGNRAELHGGVGAETPGGTGCSSTAHGAAGSSSGSARGDDDAEAEESLLSTAEVQGGQWRLAAGSTVVLSACDTARGHITPDGVVGLSRAFMAAGATAALVTLWSVNDLTTAELMGALYRHLGSGLSVPESLQLAMLDISGLQLLPVATDSLPLAELAPQATLRSTVTCAGADGSDAARTEDDDNATERSKVGSEVDAGGEARGSSVVDGGDVSRARKGRTDVRRGRGLAAWAGFVVVGGLSYLSEQSRSATTPQ